jgi:hypothetical protein
MTDVFDQNHDDTVILDADKDYLAELVGEDKKFKTPADLAKGKAHSDAHIASLERTLASLRDELKTRSTTDDLMTKIKELQNGNVTNPEPNHGSEGGAEKGLTMQDVERLLGERETARKQEANLTNAVAKLTELYGTDTPNQIQAKARELGVDAQYLKNLAKTSPQIFTSLFQPKEAPQRDPFNAPARTQVNSFGVNHTAKEKYSDFRKVQREDPNKFYSAAFQRTLDAAVIRAQNAGRYDEFMKT